MAELKRMKISDLLPDRENANQGTARGQYMLDKSMEKFGAGRSILVDKDGEVIAGNKTLQAYADLGFTEVLVIQTSGEELVAVQRADMDLDDPDTGARGLAYADNRASEVGLAWDAEQVLKDMENGIELDDFFMDFELEALMDEALAQMPENVKFEEFDESIADEVEWHECPECGHRWPK